jgi:hypothetical protein
MRSDTRAAPRTRDEPDFQPMLFVNPRHAPLIVAPTRNHLVRAT